MKTCILTTDTYLNHDTGQGHPERADRVTVVIDHLKKIYCESIGLEYMYIRDPEKVKWIQNIQTIKNGPVIFIGNEFFDSLPIKQICIRKNLFFERCVSLSKDKKKIKFVNKKANQKLIKILKNLNLIYKNDLIEYPVNAIKYLEIISKKINKFGGGLLIFDYGYNVNTNKDTLQSVKKHRYIDPLIKPSESDITSHVNFKLFYNYLKKKNLR